MAKLFKIVSSLFAILFTISLVLIFTLEIAIRLSNGTYLGYRAATQEWLLLEYPKNAVNIDGPYVFDDGNKYAFYIENNDLKEPTARKVNIDNSIVVPLDVENKGDDFAFNVTLKKQIERSALTFKAPNKLVVISDLEGDFKAAKALLISAGVINEKLEWQFGTGHLVLLGDIVDRGMNVVPLLWLIYDLESQAKKVGGDVHYVLGNHERYLLDGRAKSADDKYLGSARATNLSLEELWGENSELGLWLRSKPAAIKIGDLLFVHGGISPKVLAQAPTLHFIDERVKHHLLIGNTVQRTISDDILHDNDGILFYRNLVDGINSDINGPKASMAHVIDVLTHFDVEKIVIGYTLVENISFDFQEKVIRVDVDHASGNQQALYIEDNAYWRVFANGNKQLLPLSVSKH